MKDSIIKIALALIGSEEESVRKTDKTPIKTGIIVPMIKRKIFDLLNLTPFISSVTAGNEPIIRPAKRQIIMKGKISKSFCIIKKPKANPKTIPIPIGSKKIKHFLNSLKIFSKE